MPLPPGWVTLPTDREYDSGYKVTRNGNIEVAIELTRAIRGARAAAPTAGLHTKEEAAEAAQGPTTEESLRAPPPLIPSAEVPLPLEALGREFGRHEVVERREYGTALIPAAAVEAYRQYLARLPNDEKVQRSFIHGAAWAIYTAKLEAPTFGYYVRAAQTGGFVFEIPEPPVRQVAYRPAKVPQETPIFPQKGPQFVPVMYQTVGALIYAVNGPLSFRLDLPHFDGFMRELGWVRCGRAPRTELYLWCPTRLPSRREAPAQQQLMEGAPAVVFPVHAVPKKPLKPVPYRPL